TIDKRARSGLHPFAVADERHFSFQHIEGFVFAMMRVIWRFKPHWHLPMLQEPECPIRGLRGGPHHSGDAQESEGSIFSRVSVRGLLRGSHSLSPYMVASVLMRSIPVCVTSGLPVTHKMCADGNGTERRGSGEPNPART